MGWVDSVGVFVDVGDKCVVYIALGPSVRLLDIPVFTGLCFGNVSGGSLKPRHCFWLPNRGAHSKAAHAHQFHQGIANILGAIALTLSYIILYGFLRQRFGFLRCNNFFSPVKCLTRRSTGARP